MQISVHPLLILPVALVLSGCIFLQPDGASSGWNDIDYTALACKGGSQPGVTCKTSNDGLGEPSGHHGAHSK